MNIIRAASKLPSRSTFRSYRQSSTTSTPFQSYKNTPSTRRSITTYSTPTQKFQHHWQNAKRDHPVLLPFLIIGSITSLSVVGLLLYDDLTRIKPQFSAYPGQVEECLRKALHCVYVDPDPATAEMQFSAALKAAENCGMDMYSKDVISIRVRLAECMEKFGRVKGAVEVLNTIVKDCEDKINEIDRTGVATETRARQPEEVQDLKKALLRQTIETRAKAAELYKSDYVRDDTAAVNTLSDGIALLYKNTKDVQTIGLNENNAAGLSNMEIAMLLDQMSTLYFTSSSGDPGMGIETGKLALRSLRSACNGSRSCKEATLLSNIGNYILANVYANNVQVKGKPASKADRAKVEKAAESWLDQALQAVTQVDPDQQDTDCQNAVINASIAKATLASEKGDKAKAHKLASDLLPLFEDGKQDPETEKVVRGLVERNSA